MKIVVLDGYSLNPGDLSWQAIGALGDLRVYDRTPIDQVVNRLEGADLVFTNKTPISEETLKACPTIQWIGVLATGYNVVDVGAAKTRGIPVANIPSYGTQNVAQFTLALILEACHRIGHHNQAVKDLRWTRQDDFCFWDFEQVELDKKVLGLIGYGRIGQKVASMAQAFGMVIRVFTPNPDKSLETDSLKFVDLETLYKESDIISLHCPLQASSQGMINDLSISKMKDGVKIINTSRGPLVDEEDMSKALESGKVSVYACDVVEVEPILEDNPLLKAPNCIISPHIAWATKAARIRLMEAAEENIKAFLQGRPIHVVND